MIEIDLLMSALARRRPVFHSEADFQHEIAHELRQADPRMSARLEYPMSTGSRASLDVLVRNGGTTFGLELKYLCRAADLTVDGERFQLRQQSAHDIRRYDVIKDIARMEAFARQTGAGAGVLVLTNDPAYWRSRRSLTTADAAFDLSDGGRLSGTLAWGATAGAGTTKGRTAALALEGIYDVRWRDYATLDGVGGVLRFLYIAIASPASQNAVRRP